MRVTVCIRYDAGLFKAGGEVQALATARELKALGLDVRLHEPLNEDMGDLVHFFGAMDYFWEVAEELNRQGIPYVCSPIFVSMRTGAKLKARKVRHQIRGAYPRPLRNLFRGARALFTLSGAEERNLSDYFGPDLPRFSRIPNGVEEPFFTATDEVFRSRYAPEEPYLLHVGSYTERKNQLSVIQAAKPLGIKCVFIGQRHDAAYLESCKKAAAPGTVFLEDVAHDDPLLASAYAGALVFCLPSTMEILSIASLEAACGGAALVLGDTWGAEEYFGADAQYVNPASSISIAAGVQKALNRTYDRYEQRERYRRLHNWQSVAKSLAAEYEAVLRR